MINVAEQGRIARRNMAKIPHISEARKNCPYPQSHISDFSYDNKRTEWISGWLEEDTEIRLGDILRKYAKQSM